MREIKFRCFDTTENKLIKKITMTLDWKLVLQSGFWDERYILMQYTWLKDKNWEEIYEWDIYRADSWSGSRYVKWNNESTWFEPFVYWESPINSDEIEIIWNMYENPELLHNNI